MSRASRPRRLSVVVQKALRAPGLPGAAVIRRWVAAAAGDATGEITVRIVGDDESAALNARYRGRQGPTNVLAFPTDAGEAHGGVGAGALPPEDWGSAALGEYGDDLPPLGDVVVCAPVVGREAAEQGKALDAHWAHIVMHGTLHLLGYDHLSRVEADVMEGRERDLLAGFGFPDPYLLDGQ